MWQHIILHMMKMLPSLVLYLCFSNYDITNYGRTQHSPLLYLIISDYLRSKSLKFGSDFLFSIPKLIKSSFSVSLIFHLQQHIVVSVVQVATYTTIVETYNYNKSVFWGLIQLSCHLIRYVTPIYSPKSCLRNKLWSYTKISFGFQQLYLERQSSHQFVIHCPSKSI